MRRPKRRRSIGMWVAAGAIGASAIAPVGCRDRQTEGHAISEARARRDEAGKKGAGAKDKTGKRASEEDRFTRARGEMVRRQLRGRDITNERVLEAMAETPRHQFVPPGLRHEAYVDGPLPIGSNQTISQPYIVALMTQLAQPTEESRALDVGTGSGYQAAVLAEICKEVYSIEIVPELAESARERLKELGYDNVEVRQGDGYRGWPQHAPFDVIILAAAPDHVPQPLIDQLAPGGRLVLPVGDWYQELTVVEKQQDGSVKKWSVTGVRFVPMTGEAESRK
jgi:protein-L-isoaspartate(D-aspartate) O-methyltransferase